MAHVTSGGIYAECIWPGPYQNLLLISPKSRAIRAVERKGHRSRAYTLKKTYTIKAAAPGVSYNGSKAA